VDLKIRAQRLMKDSRSLRTNGGKPYTFAGKHFHVDNMTMLLSFSGPANPIWVVVYGKSQVHAARSRLDGISRRDTETGSRFQLRNPQDPRLYRQQRIGDRPSRYRGGLTATGPQVVALS